YTFTGTDYPLFYYRLVIGSASVHLDLVDANFTLPSTRNKRDLIDIPPVSSSGGTFQQVPIVGVLQQLLYAPRSTPDTVANGGYNVLSMKSRQFANGTTIPNGSYRVLLRALKITGDPSNENDYESWLGPVMNFAAST
ncbi:hypothetical protein M407DRAFT_71764, partial [Tulasnella calospora MUT 4182]